MSSHFAVLPARKTVTMFFAVGLAMLVLGVIVAGAAWPHTGIDALSGTPESRGSALVAMLSLGVAGVGQLLATIAVVAWGVRLGMESAGGTAGTFSVGTNKQGARRLWSEEEGRFIDESESSARRA
jgi:hypothetical protein